MIQQLVYYSISKKETSEKLIFDILETSRKNNSSKDITGCLLYHNNVFLQLLEGNKEDLSELFETLKKDTRHSNITLIIKDNIEKRMFSGWSMAFHKFDTNKSNVEIFKNSIGFYSNNIPQKTEALDLFWRMAKQIVI